MTIDKTNEVEYKKMKALLKELEKIQEQDHPKSFFQKAKTFFT